MISRSVFRLLAPLSTTGVLGVIGLIASPGAYAGVVNLRPCRASVLSQPFAPWGDLSSYELARGGDFERAAWTLKGGARLVARSEPYAATGARGLWSLLLPKGASAMSPSTCVSAAYPTIRFFIAGRGSVAVEVRYGQTVIPSGVAVAAGGWLPTPVMVTGSAIVLSGGSAHVSLRVTALSGSPRVDDVFIDPWNRG